MTQLHLSPSHLDFEATSAPAQQHSPTSVAAADEPSATDGAESGETLGLKFFRVIHGSLRPVGHVKRGCRDFRVFS